MEEGKRGVDFGLRWEVWFSQWGRMNVVRWSGSWVWKVVGPKGEGLNRWYSVGALSLMKELEVGRLILLMKYRLNIKFI